MLQVDLKDPNWITAIAAVATAFGAAILWVVRVVKRKRDENAEEQRALDARVADLQAHFESEGGRPIMVITNHGPVAATDIRVTLDAGPLELHPLFGAHYRANPLATLDAGASRRIRGIQVDYGRHVFGVHLLWSTETGRRGEWVQAIDRR